MKNVMPVIKLSYFVFFQIAISSLYTVSFMIIVEKEFSSYTAQSTLTGVPGFSTLHVFVFRISCPMTAKCLAYFAGSYAARLMTPARQKIHQLLRS